MKFKLNKNAFHLKNTGYSISVDRTMEERNSQKALLNQKKELERKEISGEWEFKIRGPPWDQKTIKTKKKEAMLTESTKSQKKLLIFYTNADNKINKRNEIGFGK